MAVGEAAAVGVDGKAPLWRNTSLGYERTSLTLFAEAEVLKEQNGVDGKGVIEFENIDVGGPKLCHLVGGLPRGRSPRDGEVGHVGDARVRDGLAAPQHIGW